MSQKMRIGADRYRIPKELRAYRAGIAEGARLYPDMASRRFHPKPFGRLLMGAS